MSEVQLFPIWKQAVSDFLAEFKYGDVVSLQWLEDHFGMPSIGAVELVTPEVMRNRAFEWLANIEAFKGALLRDHQVCLESVRGRGYRWIPPDEQTGFAMREFERDARKVFRSAGGRIKHVRISELTDEKRRENIDAAAKLSMIAGMTRKALR